MPDIVTNVLYAEIDQLRARVKELEAERDADRRREYGYSQQTVDALTLERDKLRAERNDWKSRYQSVSEMHDALIAEFNETRAENKRLAALNDMFPQEIARLEDRVSAEYEAERADDRARVKELEDENKRLQKMNPCGHTGFESAPCDICGYPDPRKALAGLRTSRDEWRRIAEEANKRIKELLDEA